MAKITGYDNVPPTKPLAYVSDAIIDCRLRSIYQSMLNKDYFRACALLNDCIRLLNTTHEVDMDKTVMKSIYNSLYNALVALGLNRPHAAHDCIRDLHYSISAKHF